jgi:hypothetical protein
MEIGIMMSTKIKMIMKIQAMEMRMNLKEKEMKIGRTRTMTGEAEVAEEFHPVEGELAHGVDLQVWILMSGGA